MRLLTIRGANLASLARPFELDLAHGPLAGVGLFAITGETGAGKSTLLDALCLALYGEYPRVSIGRRETAPDPSGEVVAIDDGRAILRRGAGQGYAEVDFIAQDGDSYRVRWEANRARGRATGRLQPEQRVLYRLSDGSAVASGKTPVRKAVEALTELTFDQFRRTVLLAQGEFDTFLLAADAERAELLEKITGTELYAHLSTRVHAGREAQRRLFENLQEKHRGIGLLEMAARTALLDEATALETSLATKRSAREDHQRWLAQALQVAAARADLALAEQTSADGDAAREAATADYDALAEFDRAESLRPLATARTEAMSARAAAQENLAVLEDQHAVAVNEAAAIEAQLAEVRATEATATATAAYFEPLWAQAIGLDAACHSAVTESEEATAEWQRAETSLACETPALAALELEAAALRARRAMLEATRAATASHRLLADYRTDLAAIFSTYTTLRETQVTRMAAAAAALEQGVAVAARRATHDAALEQARAHRDVAMIALGARRSEWQAADESTALLREGQLIEVHLALGDVQAACSDYQRATDVGLRGEANRIAATTAVGIADNEIHAHQIAEALDRAARAEVAPLAELAEAAMTPEVMRLRSLLAPTLACPVCGSVEHPRLTESTALDALIEGVRRRRQALDAALDGHRRALDEATRARAIAQDRHASAEAAIAAAMADRLTSLQRWDIVSQRLMAACVQADFPMPVGLVPDTAGALSLEGFAATVQAARAETAASLTRARDLRAQVETLQVSVDTAVSSLEALMRQGDELFMEAQAAQWEVKRIDLEIKHASTRLLAQAGILAPLLAAADCALKAFEANPAEVAAHCLALAETYATLEDTLMTLASAEQRLSPALAAARVSRLHALTQVTASAARQAARVEAVEACVAARRACLDGEATEIHRARILHVRSTAVEALAVAQKNQSVAVMAQAALAARRDEAQRVDTLATDREQATALEFTQACARLGHAPSVVLAVLATTPELVSALRARLRALDHACEHARLTVASRQSDLRRALDAFDDRPATAAITDIVAQLDMEMTALNQRAGALALTLMQDEDARETAAQLATEIDEAKRSFDVWQAVHDAIGSASGDRFRRFVQAITLDHLIALANDHLSGLSPRYQLIRGTPSDLTLHVLDRDMGDEIRGTRSLSGGERFLVSLALALALSALEGRASFVDTLFIDEGFGSLDGETLDIAIDALETLQGRGQKVGVITHVAAMIDRIAVQVRVEKRGGGRSEIRILDGLEAGP